MARYAILNGLQVVGFAEWNGVSLWRPGAGLTVREAIDGDAVAPQAPQVPQVVSRFQARAALSAAGLLPAVETAVAAAPALVQLAWANATEFHRDSATIAALAGGLGLDSGELDALFIAASGIVA